MTNPFINRVPASFEYDELMKERAVLSELKVLDRISNIDDVNKEFKAADKARERAIRNKHIRRALGGVAIVAFAGGLAAGIAHERAINQAEQDAAVHQSEGVINRVGELSNAKGLTMIRQGSELDTSSYPSQITWGGITIYPAAEDISGNFKIPGCTLESVTANYQTNNTKSEPADIVSYKLLTNDWKQVIFTDYTDLTRQLGSQPCARVMSVAN